MNILIEGSQPERTTSCLCSFHVQPYIVMKIFIVFAVTLFALNLQEGSGCTSALYGQHYRSMYTESCYRGKRFRPICPGNHNNKYQVLKKYWPSPFTIKTNGKLRSSNDSMTVSEARRKGIHFGVDILCTNGSSVQAPFRGRVIYRDDNKVILKGLCTFKGIRIIMRKFKVSSSVLVNTHVAAGDHIGYTTKHKERKAKTSYDVHIEVEGKVGKGRFIDWDPSLYICPVHIVKKDTKQRLAFFGTFGLNQNPRLISIDHDKATEEAKTFGNCR